MTRALVGLLLFVLSGCAMRPLRGPVVYAPTLFYPATIWALDNVLLRARQVPTTKCLGRDPFALAGDALAQVLNESVALGASSTSALYSLTFDPTRCVWTWEWRR